MEISKCIENLFILNVKKENFVLDSNDFDIKNVKHEKFNDESTDKYSEEYADEISDNSTYENSKEFIDDITQEPSVYELTETSTNSLNFLIYKDENLNYMLIKYKNLKEGLFFFLDDNSIYFKTNDQIYHTNLILKRV